MKRAKLFLVSVGFALLGAGCNDCAPPETVVYWNFTDASGQSFSDCQSAGASSLRLFLNGQAQFDQYGNADFTCDVFGNGVILPPYVQPGTYQLQVEAYDSNGVLLYMGQQPVGVPSCGATTMTADLAAVQGSIALNLSGFSQCPVNGYIWYSLTDVTNGVLYSAADGRTTPQAIPCAASVQFDNVPFGQYQFDFVQVVQQTSDVVTPYTAIFQNCSPVAITHTSNDVVNVTLGPATANCPGS